MRLWFYRGPWFLSEITLVYHKEISIMSFQTSMSIKVIHFSDEADFGISEFASLSLIWLWRNKIS